MSPFWKTGDRAESYCLVTFLARLLRFLLGYKLFLPDFMSPGPHPVLGDPAHEPGPLWPLLRGGYLEGPGAVPPPSLCEQPACRLGLPVLRGWG